MDRERINKVFDALRRGSERNESETGIKRQKVSVRCPYCRENVPVFLEVIDRAEGGFVKFDPPRVEEWAACPICRIQDLWTFVHREGKRFKDIEGRWQPF